jgi:hypothetical protein
VPVPGAVIQTVDSDNVISASKPGAAPVATWVSHEVIGLHNKGYGALLGEAVFSCVKVTLAMPQFW